MKATTLPGILQVQATEAIAVSYDSHYNLVEILDRGKVIRSEIAPRNYSAAAFVATVHKVRTYYSKN